MCPRLTAGKQASACCLPLQQCDLSRLHQAGHSCVLDHHHVSRPHLCCLTIRPIRNLQQQQTGRHCSGTQPAAADGLSPALVHSLQPAVSSSAAWQKAAHCRSTPPPPPPAAAAASDGQPSCCPTRPTGALTRPAATGALHSPPQHVPLPCPSLTWPQSARTLQKTYLLRSGVSSSFFSASESYRFTCRPTAGPVRQYTHMTHDVKRGSNFPCRQDCRTGTQVLGRGRTALHPCVTGTSSCKLCCCLSAVAQTIACAPLLAGAGGTACRPHAQLGHYRGPTRQERLARSARGQLCLHTSSCTQPAPTAVLTSDW